MYKNVLSSDNKALISINNNAAEVKQTMLDKKEQYDFAMNQLGIFKIAKYKAFSMFESVKRNFKTNSSEYLAAKSQLSSVLSQNSEAEINTDILRSSYQDSIFYNGKVATCAIVANYKLGWFY